MVQGTAYRHVDFAVPASFTCCACVLQGSNGGGDSNAGGRRGQLFRHSLPRMGDTNTTTAFGNLNLKDIANSLGSNGRASPPPPSPFAGAPAFNLDYQSSFQDTSSAGGELLLWACSCLPACARPFVGMLAVNQASHSSFHDINSCLRQAFVMIEAKHGSLWNTSCVGGELGLHLTRGSRYAALEAVNRECWLAQKSVLE